MENYIIFLNIFGANRISQSDLVFNLNGLNFKAFNLYSSLKQSW